MSSKSYKLYINGKLVEGQGDLVDVHNPATGELIASFKGASLEQAEEALLAAQEAFKTWSFTSLDERENWINKLKEACFAHKDEIIDLLAHETGKAYKDCNGEWVRFASYIEYFIQEAKRMHDIGLHEYSAHRDVFHRAMRRPRGVVVGHLAWNVPLVNFGAKLNPALASGCTTVLKPSTNTPLTSLFIAEIASSIGFPAGVFNVVVGPSKVIGKYLNNSTIPAMVTCIGSTATGLEIMNQVSTSVKHISLELGGNGPCIIMPDADIDQAVDFVVYKKMAQTGQSCGCVNRIFTHESIHDVFVAKLLEKVKAYPIGWGKDTPNALGAMIDISQRDKMIGFVKDSVASGAELLCGGGIPEMPDHLKAGAYFEPAVLDKVTDDMRVAMEEQFGPIYAVLTFSDLDEVIERSNNTEYGLHSYVFTHDTRVAVKCAEHLQFGRIYVNVPPCWSPNMPHVGIKQSGVGCLFGSESLEEYYVVKLLALQP